MPVPKRLIEITQTHMGLLPPPSADERPAPYVPSNPPTEANLCDWIAGATAGNAIQYHEGLLLLDRSEHGSTHPTKERARIHAVARRAWIACELGLVHLFSQKVGECHFRYLAIRSNSSLKAPDIRARLRTAEPTPSQRHPT
ncbi:hypothetical protein [Rhodoferax antarcticus]|uniref:hypothetical protein n=1 Tax=Rhodoferax antarcticus TaxID=81479 RepID=UPI00222494F6|nr:hypothetical protein [Rhodoferax antarcticus]MCW2311472.1 hypothetical protein [Rhodoferax antarcticus]